MTSFLPVYITRGLELLGTLPEHESIQLIQDASRLPQISTAITGLVHIAAREGFSAQQLELAMSTLKITERLKNAIVDFYLQNEAKVVRNLKKSRISKRARLVDGSCRVVQQLASDRLDNATNCAEFMVKLEFEDGGAMDFSCGWVEMQDLLSQIKDATRQMEKLDN
jgi:hypothetical protein